MFTSPEQDNPASDFTSIDPASVVLNASFSSILTSPFISPEECKVILDNTILELWAGQLNSNKIIHQAKAQKLRGDKNGFPFIPIKEATKLANDQVYKFAIDGIIAEDYPQIVKYGKKDFYEWHNEINPAFATRKLTFIINLSHPEEADGGKLEFLNSEFNELFNAQGSIVIFPSFTTYRITPIKKGTKSIVVGHIHGSTFK
jgi:hypothetical protein